MYSHYYPFNIKSLSHVYHIALRLYFTFIKSPWNVREVSYFTRINSVKRVPLTFILTHHEDQILSIHSRYSFWNFSTSYIFQVWISVAFSIFQFWISALELSFGFAFWKGLRAKDTAPSAVLKMALSRRFLSEIIFLKYIYFF